MRLGLLSDTHIPEVTEKLPSQIGEAFRGVDLILHSGDIYAPSVLDELECIAPVLAALGDDDPYVIRKDRRVKSMHVLKLEGRIIWLVHERPDSDLIAAQRKEHRSPDIVVFGHEHDTLVQRCDGVLFVNPGSPTFLKYRPGLGTVGILSIDSDKVQAFILQL